MKTVSSPHLDVYKRQDQDPAARPARKAWHRGDFQVWTKELSDGSVAAGVFNTGKEKGVVKVNLRELGLSGA